MATNKPSQRLIKKLFLYNPDDGLFTRRVSTSNRVKVGDIAGSLSRGYYRINVNGKQY